MCLLALVVCVVGAQAKGKKNQFIIHTGSCPNCTTTGTLTLTATIESIGFRQAFTGDADGDNSATVQYRTTGVGVWHNAYAPYTDRRGTLNGVANPYANQFRGSIVGLASNTSYEVIVSVTDPDNGGQVSQITGTVSTVNTSPTTGGSTITVTNDATLASALGSVNPGQTIHLNAGTYAAFTISRSGTSGAWINIEGEGAGTSIVSGLGVNQNIALSANYIILQHLTLSASDFSGIIAGSSAHDLFVQDNTIQNVGRLCADGPTTTHYGDSGISIGNGATNTFVLRNSVTSTSLTACVQPTPYLGPGTGIGFGDCSLCVFSSNTVTGAFRDAISSDTSSLITHDIDMSANTVSGYVDDGIESKGENLNVRQWGNIILATAADTCIADNTNTTTNVYGPIYAFRNTCYVTTSSTSGTQIYKLGGSPTYMIHNSADASATSGGVRWDAFSGEITALNNIVKTLGSIIDYSGDLSHYDYNLCTTTNGIYVFHWNSATTPVDYASFALFRSGTGQESHGLNADPAFTDTALHIGSGSPAVDTGLLMNNFNTADSAWPFTGSAPDMGALER